MTDTWLTNTPFEEDNESSGTSNERIEEKVSTSVIVKKRRHPKNSKTKKTYMTLGKPKIHIANQGILNDLVKVRPQKIQT